MKRIFIIILCTFCLTACSARLAYNFLGFIFNWYLGKYVSLDSKQQKFTDAKIDDFHDWHRATQLPLYASYIQSVIDRLDKEEITGEWIHAETDKVQLLLDNSVNYLKPSIVELVSTFSDKQTEQVLKRLKKDRSKYSKKNIEISDEKKIKKRKTDLSDQVAPFFGRFSKEQKQWLDDWARQLKPYEQLTLQQQELWAEKVTQAFLVRDNKEQLAAKLDEVMFYRTDDWDPELEAILDHNQEMSYAVLAKLVNSQSVKQRGKMHKKLKSYRDDFLSLSKKK